ncbi:DUF4269 domain-containing protein [Leptospira yasudae]|uniref:DUF4269 domain-containing protein n=1 Tax=Leptospira yasudae TaxID=2202201 RepID=A0A6N4R0Y1_9LEPT|nr:DUF4269 domain-containing protein [Leptospira yasudae]TGL80019.1 DUF4269 domain-containing protein [Leptospira yasudae]TGL80208.1 DUF4269 domain-containing protein [Leptospira yasudae]TGL81103.1 DUF4269 domain-containing protein [Leptospira yasudae]
MNFETSFLSSDYLKNGNSKQKRLWKDLEEHSILGRISKFNPVLAGTIPLGIDHDQSDADILCSFSKIEEFSEVCISSFSDFSYFKLERKKFQDADSTVVRFYTREFAYEIFGQKIPVIDQMGFVHLQVEHKILSIAGTRFRDNIRSLKRKGLKTEHAFCDLLGIKGNPYQRLFDLRLFSDEELRNLILKSEFFSVLDT